MIDAVHTDEEHEWPPHPDPNAAMVAKGKKGCSPKKEKKPKGKREPKEKEDK